MKKLENMSLEELIEFDKKHPVLSKSEFYITYFDALLVVGTLITTPIIYNTINDCLKNPTYFNASATGMAIGLVGSSLTRITSDIKNERFFSFRNSYRNYRDNLPIRKELKRLYNIILTDLLEEIEKSSIDSDPISISILVGYLSFNGYLSYTNSFHIVFNQDLYEMDNLDSYFDLEGLYVVAGYGCCRHVNSFMADLLNTKGIKSDKIPCIYGSFELLNERINKCYFTPNHLIVGYIDNNEYHLVDPFSSNYSYTIADDYYVSDSSNGLIPIFDKNLYQNELYWNSNIDEYISNSNENDKIKNKVFMTLMTKEIERFKKFKSDHFEIYEKIAYLSQIELNRSKEKEKQKLKRI